ncbi:hypothetical protein [Capnocytophaga cynodegmi]|uniref:Uncharacterized protein n=1 Tax=Capnocytophaga cynodegmi TaxID=28189 RepID=A0A0B7HMQ0_9FLAO|nr:hypothetical protein [Capnocytophaga cynodegmi]CEN40555.1 hypothetical protein CCYN74_430023 [Capnocytophaga cynodegmi]
MKEQYIKELEKLDEKVLKRLVELSKYQKIRNTFSNDLLFGMLKIKLQSEGLLK